MVLARHVPDRRHLDPGCGHSTTNSERPSCFCRSSRCAGQIGVVARCAFSSRSCVRSPTSPPELPGRGAHAARSEPASGSLMPRQKTKSAAMIPGSSSLLKFAGTVAQDGRSDLPSRRSSAPRPAPARSSSSVTASRERASRRGPPELLRPGDADQTPRGKLAGDFEVERAQPAVAPGCVAPRRPPAPGEFDAPGHEVDRGPASQPIVVVPRP